MPLRLFGRLVVPTILLCTFALVNLHPLLFPDTLTYLSDGSSLIRLLWPSNERPVFYGLAIWPFHWERSVWPIVFAQGVVISHLLWLTLRALGLPSSGLVLSILTAVLVLATPVSFYVSHIMPDIFTSALVLSLFLLIFAAGRLTRIERVYLFLLATACICFHLSHLIISASVTVAGAMLWLLKPGWRRHISVAWAGCAVVLACFCFSAFSLAVYKRIDFTPKSPPFLMARMIADGPGRDYLANVCGNSSMTICRYVDHLPATENDILWGFLGPMRVHDPATFWAIKAEQSQVVAGTIRMFPTQVAANMITGMARQFFTVDSELLFDPGARQALNERYPYLDNNPSFSLQARDGFSPTFIANFNAVDVGADIVAVIACLAFIARTDRRRDWRLIALPWTIAVAMLGNSFATGALAGVFGRYQGRIAWLLPFCALVLLISVGRTRWGRGHLDAGRYAGRRLESLGHSVLEHHAAKSCKNSAIAVAGR